MTTTIIILLCTLVLAAYVFDLTASRTKIPAVIFLLLMGWLLRQAVIYFAIPIPDLSGILPVLGTIGLILIVLEGSLELEFNKTKIPVIKKTFITSFFPLLILALGLAWILQYFGEPGFKSNLINIIPLSIISSAIAIPSARILSMSKREFIIYESSFSDILGVLLFNFVALNEYFGLRTFGMFVVEFLLMAALSFIATIGLAFLLNKIDHHIKYIPIILLVILIYAVSKIFHLPGLIFILVFGLFLGNIDELKQFGWIQKLNPGGMNKEVHKFKDLVTEAAFLIRTLFFILFGYLINTSELLNPDTFAWAVGICSGIYLLRAAQLALVKVPIRPLLFIAPRGLITILLFLSIDPGNSIQVINNSLLIQIIILTALMMMIGMMTAKSEKENP